MWEQGERATLYAAAVDDCTCTNFCGRGKKRSPFLVFSHLATCRRRTYACEKLVVRSANTKRQEERRKRVLREAAREREVRVRRASRQSARKASRSRGESCISISFLLLAEQEQQLRSVERVALYVAREDSSCDRFLFL